VAIHKAAIPPMKDVYLAALRPIFVISISCFTIPGRYFETGTGPHGISGCLIIKFFAVMTSTHLTLLPRDAKNSSSSFGFHSRFVPQSFGIDPLSMLLPITS
jgi:hypothetical protein